MRQHETWTGAANAGDKTYGVGSIEGSVFTAYASGCNIVILSAAFHRVQIIPGVCHDNIQISCLDCSSDTGKIAAAYDNQVIVFEPTPLLSNSNGHNLDYWWVETARLKAECRVATLAWNNDASRLLTAGDFLQLWQHEELEDGVEEKITFQVGHPSETEEGGPGKKSTWSCLWKNRPANPIVFLAYSPDGSLFATAGLHDRLVRIWHQNQQLMFPGQSMTQESIRQAVCSDISFSFIYLAHPRSVTGISWRKTSKYMPRGAVANMLVTSCLDNICRVWCETLLPEDGVVSMQHLDPGAAQNAKFRTHRQKARFVQRFRHMRQSFAARRVGKRVVGPSCPSDPIASLPSTYSVHEFHNYGFQGTGISPGLHFHLAGTINALTDIPLVPQMNGGVGESGSGMAAKKARHNFVLHWMNNKEMEFTVQAEKIMEDLLKMALEKDFEDIEAEMALPATESTVGIQVRNNHKRHTHNNRVDGMSHDHTGSSTSLAHSDASQPGGGTAASCAAAINTSANNSSVSLNLSDTLDHRIETILREWHNNSDLLFSIHPIDGSLLVWVADFLDEYQPGAFRQAQVSFSSRIPNALPLGDAMTMSSSVNIYNSGTVNFRELFKDSKEGKEAEEDAEQPTKEDSKEEEKKEDSKAKDIVKEPPMKKKKRQARYKPASIVSMISKHSNGTLNLWNVMFADKSKFATLLNISHKSRASGHRFRVNDITCHPVLPLLLTTSHHNVVHNRSSSINESAEPIVGPDSFCSEMILWRVDPVGPLSKSGGITELARINSHEISAFSDVAWIPTLLPSSTLGSVTNSPSACFVASDGNSLRVYQAVIDARTLLAEMNQATPKHNIMETSLMSMSSEGSTNVGNFAHAAKLHEKFNVVSTQSSARPGAIIELQPIEDATQDWQNTMLLHTFQEQVILAQGSIPGNKKDTGINLGLITSKVSAMVDLQQSDGHFNEPFYVLVAEKTQESVMLHMWRLVLASESDANEDHWDSSGSVTPDAATAGPFTQQQHHHSGHLCEVHVSTEKVCTQKLPLPPGVQVVHAVPAVGHLSSSSIYPACLAPYVMVTACTDHTVRFWRTRIVAPTNDGSGTSHFQWEEWQMESADGNSAIEVPGRPVSVSAAYTGRVAVAYQTGTSFQRKTTNHSDPSQRYVNLCTAIYECESSGGAEWIREDIIYLRNIELQPELPPMDLSVYQEGRDNKVQEHMARFAQQLHEEIPYEQSSQQQATKPFKGLMTVPSLSTLEGVKKYINAMGNSPSAIAPKQTVMLDWVSKEDGTHILTITVGNKVLFLTAVSTDISQANVKALKDGRTNPSNRPLLRKSSSMGFQQFADEVRWMQIRRIALKTVDGLNPLPMSSAWVRDGLFVIGMDSEFAVYSQWRDDECQVDESGRDIVDHRNLGDADLLTIAQESQLRSLRGVDSAANLAAGSGTKPLADLEKRKKGVVQSTETVRETELMPDFGLFEASHIACPVLPQYHPKQLMELLNSGKIRWVKAILAHLVRCIGGGDRGRQKSGGSFNDQDGSRSPRGWSRSRTLSVSYQAGNMPGSTSTGALSPGIATDPLNRSSVSAMHEEVTLDYTEINSIPPLPLWTLLAADKETNQPNEAGAGYDDLFHNAGICEEDENLENILEDEDDDVLGQGLRKRNKSMSAEKQGLSHFGPRRARVLSKLLTHAHLPGLTSLDQMHLLAMADTVASCKLDLADRFAIDAARRAMAKETSSGGEPTPEALDDCGLRFLLAMKHFTYLHRCLPIAQRKALKKQGLATSNLIWGYHSESEEELLNMIPSVAKGTPTWNELRELGVAWWVRSNATLRKVIEKVAKASFQAAQDPLDAAIFYLAMKKKSLVWGLYRSVKDEKMTAFFANNFAEDRWRKAALKNAFALLGKQRFLHAAAFFLLSGSLKDTIDICIDKLDDLQLAMVIARLYEGEINATPESLKALLYTHVLGCDQNGQGHDLPKAHPDPFLRSIALWTIKDYSGSLATLVKPNVGELHPKFTQDEALALSRRKMVEADPSVFNFYVYLRTHPLITRHNMANKKGNADNTNSAAIMLSGFRGSSLDKDSTLAEDTVTPLERKLYFSTAHFHLRAGCPALAVEVLSKLPNKVIEKSLSGDATSQRQDSVVDKTVETGTFESSPMDWSQPVPTKKKETVLKKEEKEEPLGLDWSQPLHSKETAEDELQLEWSDDPDTEEEEERGPKRAASIRKSKHKVQQQEEDDSHPMDKKAGVLDIMAQQLKFIACLKIMMEELSTLATGFEVDGGLLRYQLYIWLEREVEALKQLCNYGATDSNIQMDTNATAQDGDQINSSMRELFAAKGRKPTLHEVMMAEKVDFEAKVERATKRKAWLKANQTLLRTLLSYCSLRGGANGCGGLASVRMELILLLQELQQEKTQKQLLSPLPFPTTLPLLSACIAQQKTVVADPVRHLSALAHDMLITITDQTHLPLPGMVNYATIFLLRDMSVALSSCIYQSLSDSDAINTKKLATKDFATGAVLEALSRLSVVYQDSSLISSTSARKLSYDGVAEITTDPCKWPGVTSLRALLDRDKDDESPNLNVLLCEAFVAIYMSLFSYALATCDAHILYRLVGQKVTPTFWSNMFGGGSKKILQVTTSSHSPLSGSYGSQRDPSETQEGDQGLLNTMTNITKQRVKLNIKVLGMQLGANQPAELTSPSSVSAPEKQTFREQFSAPEMSIVSKLMNKPLLDARDLDIEVDSCADSEVEEDFSDEEDDPFSNAPPKKEITEHSNPNSYAWCLMRYACIKLAQGTLEKFLTMAGVELSELPVASPLIYASLRVTETWLDSVMDSIQSFPQAPDNFIPGCFADTTASGPAIGKYKCLFEPQNTPFPPHGHGLGPIKRLWMYLVRQESVQRVFVKFIFGRRSRTVGSTYAGPSGALAESQSFVSDSHMTAVAGDDEQLAAAVGAQLARMQQPVKIIHKEHEAITAFCINKVSSGLMTVSTQRELQELNITLLLNPTTWHEGMHDEADFDVLSLNEDPESLPASNYLVVQTPGDPIHAGSAANCSSSTATSQLNSPSGQPPPFGPSGSSASPASQSHGKGSSVVKRHRLDGVRRLAAHSHLPLYVTGCQDGSIRLWEWSHSQPVQNVRPPGVFAKVNRVRFSQQGNKFGACDGDGNVALWQAANASQPFFTNQCHMKGTSDFVFQGGSSSLFCTTGHNSDGKNVALWDTLMPHKRCLVQSYAFHESGASALLFAPQHHQLVTAGKKGQVSVWDIRQHRQLHFFKAHDHPIKCLALDPNEDFFVTGSVDGDIKIWSLSSYKCYYTFVEEHARHGIFKNISQGVSQVHVDSHNRLFSCGADGSMKVRQLPDRDFIVSAL